MRGESVVAQIKATKPGERRKHLCGDSVRSFFGPRSILALIHQLAVVAAAQVLVRERVDVE